MTLEEKYKEYKHAIEIQQRFSNFSKKGKLKFNCNECGKEINVNGATSHSKVHKSVMNDKFQFLKKYFNVYDTSVFSGKRIFFENPTRRKYITVLNAKEYLKIVSFVFNFENHYRICPICHEEFIGKSKTCSFECGNKLTSKKLKKYWKEIDEEAYLKRNEKISNWRLNNPELIKYNVPVWNKGLRGSDYLKHFEKEDGSNSLLDSIKKNKVFFKKTSIEEKIENLLKKLNLRYQYSWFSSGRQFDFLVSFENFVLIVECDGDYWHKSKRICLDENIRKMKRLEDKLKENVIKKLSSTKPFYVIRFWEYNINENFDKIEKYFNDFLETNNIESLVKEINDWYNTNG